MKQTVLLTGATGYIGRRLEKVLREDIALRLLVRNTKKLTSKTLQHAEVVEGDTFRTPELRQALAGIDTAIYLIHSMGTGHGFSHLDRLSAENFLNTCLEQGVKKSSTWAVLACRNQPLPTWPAASRREKFLRVNQRAFAPSGSGQG